MDISKDNTKKKEITKALTDELYKRIISSDIYGDPDEIINFLTVRKNEDKRESYGINKRKFR